MTVSKILESLQYGDKFFCGGRAVKHVALAGSGYERMHEENIKLFVVYESGERMVILSGDLEARKAK